jgi:hypothetical protein
MTHQTKELKIAILIACLVGFATSIIFGDRAVVSTFARSGGSPNARSGAPGEQTCTTCHAQNVGPGQIQITAPVRYTPGQTFPITVTQTTTDSSRLSWGFQLTALDAATNSKAGTLSATTGSTAVANSSTRQYMNHTVAGKFEGQTGQANWTFNWTAPATDVGAIKFYVAGIQADNGDDDTGDQTYTTNITTLSATPTPTPVNQTRFNFDTDTKTDLAVFRPSNSQWYVMRSGGGFMNIQWGMPGDAITPADFDGDGRTDLAVWRPSNGNWFIINSSDNTVNISNWGLAGDQPVPADFNGDTKADVVVYRPTEGKWYRRDSDGQIRIISWGQVGDKPAPADFDGDRVTDMTVYRPSEGKWYLINSLGGAFSVSNWGVNGDLPIPGDYDGDGKADFAVFRPGDMTWHRIFSSNSSIRINPWGFPGDIVTPGDFDGDGKMDLAVFRPSNGTWYMWTSTVGMFTQPFGVAGDIPIPNVYVY